MVEKKRERGYILREEREIERQIKRKKKKETGTYSTRWNFNGLGRFRVFDRR